MSSVSEQPALRCNPLVESRQAFSLNHPQRSVSFWTNLWRLPESLILPEPFHRKPQMLGRVYGRGVRGSEIIVPPLSRFIKHLFQITAACGLQDAYRI